MWIPLMLKSECVRPLIFGSGSVACRKALTLCKYGIQSCMVSPEPPQWDDANCPKPVWMKGQWEPGMLEDGNLIIAATDSPVTNMRICWEAERMGKLALNASKGDEGNVQFPASEQRQDIVVSVSTSGSSPAAAKEILMDLMKEVDRENWQDRIRLLGELRKIICLRETDVHIRRKLLKELSVLSLEGLIKRRSAYED